jgi:hypothetical protein
METLHIESYKWKPGQSGNPMGRPRGMHRVAKELQKTIGHDGRKLMSFLLDVAEGKKTQDIRVQIQAIEILLNRAFGRPISLHL